MAESRESKPAPATATSERSLSVIRTSEVKPTITFDIDGVLFDFITPCLKELSSKYHGVPTLDMLTRHHHLEDHLMKHNPAAHEHMVEKIVRNPDFYNRMQPLPGAMRMVSSLSRDFTIWAITARPWNVVTKTRDKMSEFFPAIGDNVISTHDKVKARKALNSLIHVEDHSGIVKKMADSGQDVIVLDWPYNRDLKPNEKIIRVKNLQEAEDVIRTVLGKRNV